MNWLICHQCQVFDIFGYIYGALTVYIWLLIRDFIVTHRSTLHAWLSRFSWLRPSARSLSGPDPVRSAVGIVRLDPKAP